MSEYPDMRQRRSGGSFYSAFRWPGVKGIIEVSLKTSDPKIAQERLADLRSDLRRGVDPRGVFKNIEKACENYLKTVTPAKAEKSQYMDRSRIKNHINPYFSGKRLGHVANDESCIAYKAFRESEGASRETIEKELWLLKGIINTVFPEFKLLPFKDKRWGKWHKPKKVIVRFLMDEQWEKVIGLCDDETHDLVVLARFTGLRLGDCVNLQWPQVDLFRGQIIVNPGKTSADDITVTVPIMPPLEEVLTRLNKFRRINDHRVFIVEPNEQAFKRRIQRGFKSACIEAGLPEFRFHDLRHDFCSQLIQNNGGNIYPVADLAGHKSIRTTRKYAHLSDDNRLASMEQAFRRVKAK